MILYRRGYGLFDQEKLAKFLGVKVPKNIRVFAEKIRTCENNYPDPGLPTTDSADIINQFFRHNNIGLCAISVKPKYIGDIKEFLIKNIRQNNDMWFEYLAKNIHKNCKYNAHDGLIESIIIGGKHAHVTVMDPDPEHISRFVADISKIADAISYFPQAKRYLGFIVISKK
jgi:hypothetical protein